MRYTSPFPGLFRYQIPEMTNLRLADAVDAPEALFDTVRVPRQVVVHHQMGPLEVDALPGRVSSEQHLHQRIVEERLLGLAAILPPHAPVNGDDARGPAEQRCDTPLEVVEGVPVLGEKDQLLAG